MIIILAYEVSERMVNFVKYRPNTFVSYFYDSDNPVAEDESVLESILAAFPTWEKDLYDIKKDSKKFEEFELKTTPSIVIEST